MAQGLRVFVFRGADCADVLIDNDAFLFVSFAGREDAPLAVGLEPCDEEDAFGVVVVEHGVVEVGAVEHHDTAGRHGRVPCGIEFVGFAVGDHGERRESSLPVKKGVHLNGSFSGSVLGPRIQGKAQRDDSGVHDEKSALELELLALRASVATQL